MEGVFWPKWGVTEIGGFSGKNFGRFLSPSPILTTKPITYLDENRK